MNAFEIDARAGRTNMGAAGLALMRRLPVQNAERAHPGFGPSRAYAADQDSSVWGRAIGLAALGAVIVAAAVMLAVAAVAAVLVGALVAIGAWALRAVRGRRGGWSSGAPPLLEARRTPDGWVAETSAPPAG